MTTCHLIVQQTPERNNLDGVPDQGSAYEARPYLRWVGRPEYGWLLKGGKIAHFELVRIVAGLVTRCDRCGGTEALEPILADAPRPHLIAVFLDEQCREALDVGFWSITR